MFAARSNLLRAIRCKIATLTPCEVATFGNVRFAPSSGLSHSVAPLPKCAKGLNRSRCRAPPPIARCGERLRGASCLKMRSCNPHSRQEPPHDRPGNEPVTPAHDRRHDDPEVRAEDPT